MSKKLDTYKITTVDKEVIRVTKHSMENIGWAMQGLNRIGVKMESGFKKIPEKQQQWLQEKTTNVLSNILHANLTTMQKGKSFKKPISQTYKSLVIGTGAISGAFGAATGVGTAVFVCELSVYNHVFIRSIIDKARIEGEDVVDIDTQLSCLAVFALGGVSEKDDGLDNSYFATRVALRATISGASVFISKNGISGLGKALMMAASPLTQMIGLIASRFTIQVSEKFLAQAVPLVGAAGGGTINYLFMDHFQKMAKAHFTLRRLERKYGEELVRTTYLDIKI